MRASRSRRQAREIALRACYAMLVGGATPQEALGDQNLDEVAIAQRRYASRLVEECAKSRREFDARTSAHLSPDWSVSRLATLDRIILWLVQAEFWHQPDVPPKVTLAEAIALAKKFSGEDSPKFVHGVAAALLASSPKADWQGPPVDSEPEMLSEDAAPEPPPPAEVEEPPTDPDTQRVGPWTISTRIEPDEGDEQAEKP